MNAVLRLFVSILALELICIPDNSGRSPLVPLYESALRVWNDKRISISGNKMLAAEEVRRSLPLERSAAWWATHLGEVGLELRKNSLVADVTVSRSPACFWGCFDVRVVEHQPRFATFAGNRAWLIADDGSFVSPIAE